MLNPHFLLNIGIQATELLFMLDRFGFVFVFTCHLDQRQNRSLFGYLFAFDPSQYHAYHAWVCFYEPLNTPTPRINKSLDRFCFGEHVWMEIAYLHFFTTLLLHYVLSFSLPFPWFNSVKQECKHKPRDLSFADTGSRKHPKSPIGNFGAP